MTNRLGSLACVLLFPLLTHCSASTGSTDGSGGSGAGAGTFTSTEIIDISSANDPAQASGAVISGSLNLAAPSISATKGSTTAGDGLLFNDSAVSFGSTESELYCRTYNMARRMMSAGMEGDYYTCLLKNLAVSATGTYKISGLDEIDTIRVENITVDSSNNITALTAMGCLSSTQTFAITYALTDSAASSTVTAAMGSSSFFASGVERATVSGTINSRGNFINTKTWDQKMEAKDASGDNFYMHNVLTGTPNTLTFQSYEKINDASTAANSCAGTFAGDNYFAVQATFIETNTPESDGTFLFSAYQPGKTGMATGGGNYKENATCIVGDTSTTLPAITAKEYFKGSDKSIQSSGTVTIPDYLTDTAAETIAFTAAETFACATVTDSDITDTLTVTGINCSNWNPIANTRIPCPESLQTTSASQFGMRVEDSIGAWFLDSSTTGNAIPNPLTFQIISEKALDLDSLAGHVSLKKKSDGSTITLPTPTASSDGKTISYSSIAVDASTTYALTITIGASGVLATDGATINSYNGNAVSGTISLEGTTE
jgi:hypothetical protein